MLKPLESLHVKTGSLLTRMSSSEYKIETLPSKVNNLDGWVVHVEKQLEQIENNTQKQKEVAREWQKFRIAVAKHHAISAQ